MSFKLKVRDFDKRTLAQVEFDHAKDAFAAAELLTALAKASGWNRSALEKPYVTPSTYQDMYHEGSIILRKDTYERVDMQRKRTY